MSTLLKDAASISTDQETAGLKGVSNPLAYASDIDAINDLLVLLSHNVDKTKHRGLAIGAAKTKQERLYRLELLLHAVESDPDSWRYREADIPWAILKAKELLGL
ncbi:MAG: hypothetical protein ACK5LL_07150 [Suipraeoptans sp.]